MKINKNIILILFTLILFLFATGCEKDTALPKNSVEADSTVLSDASSNKTDEKVNTEAKDDTNTSESGSSENNTTTTAPEKSASSTNTENENAATETKTNTSSTNSTTTDDTKQQSSSGSETTNAAASTKSTTTQQNQAPVQSETSQPTPQQVSQVTVSVQGVDGVILAPTLVTIEANETAFTATIKQLKASGIQYESTGSGPTAYIKGINNLYEFDYGPMSGWIFKKNGVTPGRSSGAEPVQNGDQIEWIYKTE